MELPDPFRWDGDHLAVDLPGAHARFTTRRGGVSAGAYASLNLGDHVGDDPEAVAVNRERLRAALGVASLIIGTQVHGVGVGPAGEDGEADARVTRERGVACAVVTADCLPIALAGDDAVAMVHAGWPGLAAGVVEAAAAALGGPVRAAAIGPGVGGCCYEVGPEVHAAFGRDVPGKATIDLRAIARERLGALGAAAVHDVGLCTICADPSLFFSHRRDRGTTGRQGGVAWRS